MPSVTRVAILFNPPTAPRGGSYYFDPFKAANQSLGLETVAALVHDTWVFSVTAVTTQLLKKPYRKTISRSRRATPNRRY